MKIKVLDLNSDVRDCVEYNGIKIRIGDIIEPKCVSDDGDVFLFSGRGKGATCDCGKHCWVLKRENYEIINDKKSTMKNIKESFVLLLKSEPEKSFRKAGITDGDDLLTNDGQLVFLTWLLNKNKDVFKTEVVDGLLADKEDK